MREYISSKQTMEIIKDIADRMRNPDVIRDTTLNPENKNPSPKFPRTEWNPLSAAEGYPGMLPLYSELDRLFPNEKWDEPVHEYVLKIKEEIELNGINQISIFDGVAGICFYLQLASRDGSRYQKMINTLNQILANRLDATFLATLRRNMKSMKTSPPYLYNLFYGITGIGTYLFKNQREENFAYLLGEILDLLVLLTYPSTLGSQEIPGWCYLYQDQTLDDFHYDLGLCYGIGGVLSFLSLTLQKGIATNGQEQAIETISHWLMERFSFTGGLVQINNRFVGEPTASQMPSKHNWAYGLLGTSRSLFLAGQALRNEKMKDFATKVYIDYFQNEGKEIYPSSQNIAYGTAGILLLTQAMAKETQSPLLVERVLALKDHLLNSFQTDNLFGFKDSEWMTNESRIQIDRAGLFTGSTGILLTLLHLEIEASSWLSPFLIES